MAERSEDPRATQAREKAEAAAKAAVEAAAKAAAEAAAKATAEAAAKAAAEEAARPKVLKMHTIAPGETLSHLALKYYGYATPEYWKLIIEANKAELGEDIKNYGPGKTIIIPILPDSMKKPK
jgi:nucleoid-associated protein YgaU